LRDTFRRFPSVEEVRVFGSRVTGDARRASDVDLAIFAPRATSREWAELCEALERAPLIYELDLVRAARTTSERLKDKIEREGIAIYPEE
jgi:predicted nucleotidyltransferase